MAHSTHIAAHVRLSILFLSCSCAVGFGAQTGISVDTKGRVSIGVRAMTRTGFWSDRDPTSQRVVYWFPELTVGAAWEVSTHSLRVDAGVPSLGWARYTKDAWEPSFQLVAPHVSARLGRHGFSELRGCGGVAVTYEKSLRFTQETTFKRTHQTVGAVGELDLCWSKHDGVFGSIFGGAGYELVLLQ